MSELRDALTVAREALAEVQGRRFSMDRVAYALGRIDAALAVLATPEGATCDGSGMLCRPDEPPHDFGHYTQHQCPGCPACRVEGGD